MDGFSLGKLTTTYRVMDIKRPIRRSEKPSSAKNNAVVGRKEEISISSAFSLSFSHSFSLFFSYDTKQKTKCRYHNFSLNISINQTNIINDNEEKERETEKHTQNNRIRSIRQHTKTSRQNHKIGIPPRLVYAHQSKFMIKPCPGSSLDDCCCCCCHSNNKFYRASEWNEGRKRSVSMI